MSECDPSSPAESPGSVDLAKATSSGTSASDLERLARSPDSRVRVAIALNPSTPQVVIALLLQDRNGHVRSALRQRGAKLPAMFVKPRRVLGHKLVFRDATVHDAEFILRLRTDPAKSRYLSRTPPDLANQVAWMERYARDQTQLYFIIETRAGERVGTVRLYDQRGSSFCWGSWIKDEGAPSGFALESATMVYAFAMELGFDSAHGLVVLRGNARVAAFHERYGAARVSETQESICYEMRREQMIEALVRYREYLPDGVVVEYP